MSMFFKLGFRCFYLKDGSSHTCLGRNAAGLSKLIALIAELKKFDTKKMVHNDLFIVSILR